MHTQVNQDIVINTEYIAMSILKRIEAILAKWNSHTKLPDPKVKTHGISKPPCGK